jgi:hypothetical protein
MTLEEWVARFNSRVKDLSMGPEEGPLVRAHERGESPELIAEVMLRVMDAEDDGLDDDDADDEFRAVWKDDDRS